jgi:hypothetical protein
MRRMLRAGQFLALLASGVAAGWWGVRILSAEVESPRTWPVLGSLGLCAFALVATGVGAWTAWRALWGPPSFYSRRRESARAGGGEVPVAIRLAGLVVPVGSLVWARGGDVRQALADAPVAAFTAVAVLGLVAAVVLLFQEAVLAWLTPVAPGAGRRLADRLQLEGFDREEPGRREAYEDWRPYGDHRDDEERRRDDELTRRLTDELTPAGVPGVLARPLVGRSAAATVAKTATNTGLVVDVVWPRIAMVLPDHARRFFRRADRAIAALRVGVASNVCTMLVWFGAAVGWLAPQSDTSQPWAVLVGPAAVAAVLFLALRRLVDDTSRRRADAVDLYRFDLARVLHLPIPRDPRRFRALAGALTGDRPADRHLPSPDPARPSAAQADMQELGSLREDVVDEVTRRIVAEIRRMRVRDDDPARRLHRPSLSDDEISALADQVAERAAGPVGEQVSRRIEDLQRRYHQEVDRVVREGVEAAVLGPPLVSFTGFLVIDAKTGGEDGPPRQPGGVVAVPVGGLLELAAFVVRDQAARGAAPLMESDSALFVVEPIHIEGGRPASLVEFDAVMDSATLRPSPHRATMAVGAAGSRALFGFRMPDRAGRHEVWFQLYQAGRLIQVVAITVETTATPTPVRR